MGKPCLDRNGKPIYVVGGSDAYKKGYSKIKWGVNDNGRFSQDTNANTTDSGNRDQLGYTGKPTNK